MKEEVKRINGEMFEDNYTKKLQNRREDSVYNIFPKGLTKNRSKDYKDNPHPMERRSNREEQMLQLPLITTCNRAVAGNNTTYNSLPYADKVRLKTTLLDPKKGAHIWPCGQEIPLGDVRARLSSRLDPHEMLDLEEKTDTTELGPSTLFNEQAQRFWAVLRNMFPVKTDSSLLSSTFREQNEREEQNTSRMLRLWKETKQEEVLEEEMDRKHQKDQDGHFRDHLLERSTDTA